MSPVEESPITLANPQQIIADLLDWESNLERPVYECRVLICPEEGGGYSAHALKLPGVVSEGDTPEEAAARIAEAFREAIMVYQESGEPIPWEHAVIDRPKGSMERWILVNV